jgi:hypothetical protein
MLGRLGTNTLAYLAHWQKLKGGSLPSTRCVRWGSWPRHVHQVLEVEEGGHEAGEQAGQDGGSKRRLELLPSVL